MAVDTTDPSSTAPSSTSTPRHIVVIGTGIIGLSTAYYLTTLLPLTKSGDKSSNPDTTIHLLDSSPQLFYCASGRAGGFLARDWFSSAVADVGALSFDLHRQLADEFDGGKEWGYVPTVGISVVLGGKQKNKKSDKSIDDDIDDDDDGGGDADVGEGVRGEDWLFNGTSRVRAAVGNGYDGEEVEKDEREVPWWFDVGSGTKVERMSSGETTGTVNPLHLCQFLLRKVKERGVKVSHPVQVRKANTSSIKSLESITFTTHTTHSHSSQAKSAVAEEDKEEHTIPCTHLLISSGVWSPTVFKTLFPKSKQKIPITSLSGHHVVLRPTSFPPTSLTSPTPSITTPSINSNLPSNLSHTVFVTPPPSSSNPIFSFSPEIFARSNGDIYFAGLNSSTIPLPPIATDVTIIQSEVSKLEKLSRYLIPNAQVVSSGLCHRPVTSGGKPIVVRVRDEVLGLKKMGGNDDDDGMMDVAAKGQSEEKKKKKSSNSSGGVFIAAGHGPWGISMSLGTGKVMAEMMLGMKTSADVSRLGIY